MGVWCGRISGMNIITEKKFAAGLSISSNALIIVLKFIAGIISGSISIISEAIHSLSDFLASVLTFFAVMKSSEPADRDHPFGHGKYEDMSGFIEGGLIIFAAVYIIFEALRKLLLRDSLEVNTNLGIAVMLFASVANFFVSRVLFRVAKKSDSVSLFADGEHLRTDIYSSLGVMAGLILIKITGIYILDPIIAIFVALFIFKAGFSIAKETLNNLLDGSLPDKDLKIIEDIIYSYKNNNVSGFKNLKARRCGPCIDIELTIIFPSDMSILKCHNVCDEIEELICKKLKYVTIMIHPEPECEKCAIKKES